MPRVEKDFDLSSVPNRYSIKQSFGCTNVTTPKGCYEEKLFSTLVSYGLPRDLVKHRTPAEVALKVDPTGPNQAQTHKKIRDSCFCVELVY